MNSVAQGIFWAVIGALTTIALWRELPLQYVLSVAAITFGVNALGALMLSTVCWWLPLAVLNSRGVGRLMLYRWRDRAYYGWWLIGLSCALSSVLVPRWSTPVLAVVMQIAAMPWLIKRRPAEARPSYFPLLNWLILAGWAAARKFDF